jgi:hypothetical protein
LLVVSLVVGLCGCDPRRDFAGTYEVSGLLTTRSGGSANAIPVDNAQLVVVADALDSDKLYLDFDCGLSGTMDDAESFKVDTKRCPSYMDEDCEITWTFKEGTGRRVEEGSKLEFNLSGSIQWRCYDGTAGQVGFAFALLGTRLGEGLAQSSAQSALRSALERELRSHLR